MSRIRAGKTVRYSLSLFPQPFLMNYQPTNLTHPRFGPPPFPLSCTWQADDDVANINPRWNVSTFVEPPKEQLLISVKHTKPNNNHNNPAAAAASASASASAAASSSSSSSSTLNEKDIKRLVKKAVPITRHAFFE